MSDEKKELVEESSQEKAEIKEDRDANLLNTSPMSDKIAQIQAQRGGSKSLKYYKGLRTKH